jgi:phage tail sheath protein FI
MQFTSMYTGSLGNSIQVTISAGTQVGTYRIVVAMPGLVPENFDNISGSGNALWLAMASAVNNGITGVRGPSKIITASAGTSTAAPALATYALSGGTDGATTINGAVLLGQDSTPRKGMYALRGTQAGIGMLADCDDSTTWSTQVQFGLSQGIYMIGTGPAGDTISNAINVKAAAGIDSYAFKLIFGDWVYINDTVNAMQRMISPQGFEAGMLGALSPEQSSLNKQMQGIIGTQKTIQNLVYSYAELQSLGQAGFELITNPSPGGNYFAARFGRNSSSNATIHWDSYTRMTNYLAATLNAGMGKYDGDLQSASVRAQALATINYFLSNLWDQGMIGNPAGTIPYSTKCDNTNNSSSREALGYMQIDVKVQYLAVIDYLIINLEGGSIVQIQNGNALPAQAAA